MSGGSASVLVHGFAHLVVSQVSTRLITFFLNLLTARLLTVDAYGLLSVQFHLINTTILFLSREGFRRGCLRAQQVQNASGTRTILGIAALCIPLGAVVTLCVCAVALRKTTNMADPYAAAILLQGLAAMVELASEPLYILAQVRLKLQLRVVAEAAATLARGVLTLALLKTAACDVAITLSLAQLAYAAVTLLVYGRHFGRELLSSCSGEAGGAMAPSAAAKAAALLDLSLTAAAPDDPPTGVPGPAIAELAAELVVRPAQPPAQPGQAGPAAQAGGEFPHGGESPGEGDLSVEQGESDAEGWELLSKRMATPPAGPSAHPWPARRLTRAATAAAAAQPKAAADAPEAGVSEAEGLHMGLRHRGSRLAGEVPSGAAKSSTEADVDGSSQEEADAKIEDKAAEEAGRSLTRLEVIWMCGIFTLQALEKLLLAEGSKMVMLAFQSTHAQGVYGLVTNLGSLVVRTIFQPFEEAAFLAFSRIEPGLSAKETAAQHSRVFAISVRCVAIVGLLAVAFGPAYTYAALRLAYGERWSETAAPVALGAYCPLILLLALNGILEAFVHAVARSRDVTLSNAWLVVCSGVHLALAVALVRSHGAVGLILADAANMALRIAYCLHFTGRHFAAVPGHTLHGLFPSRGALTALAAAAAACLASNGVFLGGLGLPHGVASALRGVPTDVPGRTVAAVGFRVAAAGHVCVGASSLVVTLYVVYRAEAQLLSDILALKRAAA